MHRPASNSSSTTPVKNARQRSTKTQGKKTAPQKNKSPIVGIGVVIIHNDKVLLVRRANPPLKGLWTLPGGKQKFGETIFECATREIQEETGLLCRPIEILTALDIIIPHTVANAEMHYTVIEVLAEYIEGEAKAASDAIDVLWATMPEIETLCPHSDVPRIVRLAYLQKYL